MADHYFGNNDTVNEFLQYLIAEVITVPHRKAQGRGQRKCDSLRDRIAWRQNAAPYGWLPNAPKKTALT